MTRRFTPLPGLLVLLALAACENAIEPGPASPRPQFNHDPATLVTNLNNDGPGSLREVVFNASSGSTVHFAAGLAGGTIVVGSPISILQSVTIEGPASGGIRISGGGATTVFQLVSGSPTVTLRNLTIVGADGGMPFDGHGTAIFLAAGTLNVIATTLTANQAAAITVVGGDLLVENSTISGNGGDGINASGGAVVLFHATIARNAGAGIDRSVPLTLRNSLIVENTTDCSVPIGTPPATVSGTNLDSDDSCGLASPAVNPLIGPLANNGGPTPTHALEFGSPAVNAAPSCVVATDQRGVERPQNTLCDIGAYERIPVSVTLTIDPTGTVNPKTGAATLTGTLACSRALGVELQVDLEQVQMVRRVPVPKQASATVTVACTGPVRTWSATISPPAGAAFVNGAATAAADATNSDNDGAAEREIRLFWAKK